MMRRVIRILTAVLALLLCCLTSFAREDSGRDSLVFAQLDLYLAEVDRLSIAEAAAEADFIISGVADSCLRNSVASKVYRHFRESKVMGAENVAIYVYDNWFATFRTLFDDVDEFEEAGMYAMINRPSLIGCPARRLCLQDMDGREYELPAKGRNCVIYFYSAECPKCLLYSRQLVRLLGKVRKKLNFYSVYTGEDDVEWRNYVSKELPVKKRCRLKVFHLKGGDSSFPLDYGVIQTPRLFLVARDGIILGRNLDCAALETLLGALKQ